VALLLCNSTVSNYNLYTATVIIIFQLHVIEGLRERTEHLDVFLFFRPSLNGDLLLVFSLLVEGECQILKILVF